MEILKTTSVIFFFLSKICVGVEEQHEMSEKACYGLAGYSRRNESEQNAETKHHKGGHTKANVYLLKIREQSG